MMGAPLSESSSSTGLVATVGDRLVTVRRRPAPDEALAELLAGNERFASGSPRYGHDVASPAARTEEHRPWALVIGCLDSRVPPEGVLDQDFGSIVVVRTGGHVLDKAGLGSVEFAVSVFEVPLVVVLGHQYCGAVAASVQAAQAGTAPGGALGSLVDEIAPAVHEARDGDPAGLAGRAAERHVTRTASRLMRLDAVRDRVTVGDLAVVGAWYEVDTGRVTVLGR
jgi:carbonic anhydrase